MGYLFRVPETTMKKTAMAPIKTAPPRISNEVLDEKIMALRDDFVAMRSSIDKLADGMSVLIKVEERQAVLIDEMSRLAAMHSAIEVKGEAAHDAIYLRLTEIEKVMPGLIETRRWVVSGIIAGVAMMLIAVASLVIVPRPLYMVAPQQAPVIVSPSAQDSP
jgi:hypothetical protein